MFHRDLRGDISRIRYINATRRVPDIEGSRVCEQCRLSSELSVNQSRGIRNSYVVSPVSNINFLRALSLDIFPSVEEPAASFLLVMHLRHALVRLS